MRQCIPIMNALKNPWVTLFSKTFMRNLCYDIFIPLALIVVNYWASKIKVACIFIWNILHFINDNFISMGTKYWNRISFNCRDILRKTGILPKVLIDLLFSLRHPFLFLPVLWENLHSVYLSKVHLLGPRLNQTFLSRDIGEMKNISK